MSREIKFRAWDTKEKCEHSGEKLRCYINGVEYCVKCMPPQKESWDGTLLPGMPEIQIIKLVRRAHDSSVCPHKGNCLNEDEMFKEVHLYLEFILSQTLEAERTRIRELVEELSDDLTKSKPQALEVILSTLLKKE